MDEREFFLFKFSLRYPPFEHISIFTLPPLSFAMTDFPTFCNGFCVVSALAGGDVEDFDGAS
jgi:hypothetical protein